MPSRDTEDNRQTILAILQYQPESGRFFFRRKKELTKRDHEWNARYAGKETGRAKQGKRAEIYINGQCVKAHRCAFVCMTGRFPSRKTVDHISGDPSDNRWVNLREATDSENQCNKRVNRSNIGIKGIRYTGPSWVVDISCSGKRYRKSFRDFDLCLQHYAEMAPKIQGPYAVLASLNSRGQYVPTSAI